MKNTVVQLTVRNHPGAMSHVAGLFARRAFNLEGIICRKIGDGATSQMLLLVNEDDRLEQILKQLQKLYDVVEVSLRADDSVGMLLQSLPEN
jgi:acetolactate synthase I/III small subunit